MSDCMMMYHNNTCTQLRMTHAKYYWGIRSVIHDHHTYSGEARPRPTRACALLSTFRALPSAISFESRDSTMDQTEINCSANNHKSATNIDATVETLYFTRARMRCHHLECVLIRTTVSQKTTCFNFLTGLNQD